MGTLCQTVRSHAGLTGDSRSVSSLERNFSKFQVIIRGDIGLQAALATKGWFQKEVKPRFTSLW